MERRDRVDLLGGSLLLSFSLIMGLNQVLIRIVNDGLEPVFQAGLRSACAFPLVLAFALIMGRRLRLGDGTLWPGIVIGLCFAAEFLLMFKALDYTSVARVAILFYTMPIWVAGMAHFLIPNERLTPMRALGLGVAIAGVALALGRDHAPQSDWSLLGDLMALAGAFFWAVLAITVRLTRLSEGTPEMALLYQLAVSAVVLLVAAPLFGEPFRQMTPDLWAIFSFQVVVVVCIGFLAWFWVLQRYPASDMASWGFLAPLFGVVFSWLILKEPIGLNVIAALALVACGIVLVNRKPRAG